MEAKSSILCHAPLQCFCIALQKEEKDKGHAQKEITGLFGNFSHIGGGGGGLPNSQNFCKLTKYFLYTKFILRW